MISRLVCGDTEQLVPWLHRIGREYVLVLYTVRGRHSFHSFDILDPYFAVHVEHYTSTRLLPVLVTNPNTVSTTV